VQCAFADAVWPSLRHRRLLRVLLEKMAKSGLQGAVQHGTLGVVRQGQVDYRYFVLRKDCLVYYSSLEEAENGSEKGGRLNMDDIEELDILEQGFRIGLSGNGATLELQVKNQSELQPWVEALTQFFEAGDGGGEEGGGDGEDEIEEEVLHDSQLILEANNTRVQKHFWLFHDRLEYTDTEESPVAEGSYELHTITGITVTAAGFDVRTTSGDIGLTCAKKDAQMWVKELQAAFGQNAKNRSAKGTKAGSSAPKAAEKVSAPAPAASSSNGNRQPSPAQPSQASRAAPLGSTASTVAPSTPMSTPSPDGKEALCKGELGVVQKDREDKRYFVLYDETFEYWTEQADYERGIQARGCVNNTSVVDLENTSGGFIVNLENNGRLELRCKTSAELNLWRDQWREILRSRPNSQQGYNNSSAPLASSQQKPAGVPGLIFMANLSIDSNGGLKKRHFALFDNRIDYYAQASDMNSGRYPRGRILLRDIETVDFKGNGMELCFSDPDLPRMALVAENTDLTSWNSAWTQAGVPRAGASAAQQQQWQQDQKSRSPEFSEGWRTPPPPNYR